jgi:hypothetical protein
VIALAFRFREFLGWLQQDSGRYSAAMESTNRALDMATELGDPFWNAPLLMRKSNIATDADDPATAAALADAALSTASGAPPSCTSSSCDRKKVLANIALSVLDEHLNDRTTATPKRNTKGHTQRQQAHDDHAAGPVRTGE